MVSFNNLELYIYFLQGLSRLWKTWPYTVIRDLNYPKCYCYVQNVILSYSESSVASLGYLSPLYRITISVLRKILARVT